MTGLLSGRARIEPAVQPVMSVADRAARQRAIDRAAAELPLAKPVYSETVARGVKAFALVTRTPKFEGSARAYVESLLPASRQGDAQASYLIYLRVRACRYSMREVDDAELAAYRKVGLERSVLEGMEQTQLECAELFNSPDLLTGSWLETAARQGSLEAQLMYAINPADVLQDMRVALSHPERVLAYRAQAMAYLHAAASQGSVDALIRLATAYEADVLTSKDRVAALAYWRAAQRVSPALAGASFVAHRSAELTADELTRSRSMADRIYADCCVR